MKILLKIFITLLLFISTLGGLLFVWANNDNAYTVENTPGFGAAESLARMMGAGSTIGHLPTASDYHRAAIVDGLFAVFCVVAIVFTFLRGGKSGGLVVTGILAVLAVLLIVFQPSFDGTAFEDENSDKVLATVIGVMGIIAAGLLLLLKTKFSNPPSTPIAPASIQ